MWLSVQAGRTIMNRYHNSLDRFITGADKALRVLAGVHSASRPNPAVHAADAEMTEQEHRHSAGLMREPCGRGDGAGAVQLAGPFRQER
jgi:hypothetical protein